VKDDKDSLKLAKRIRKAKRKAKKVLILKEQQQQAIAAMVASAMAEERLYHHKRKSNKSKSMTQETTQTTNDVFGMTTEILEMEMESNNIAYNDCNEKDEDNTNNCFLTQLLPLFQQLKASFDDQLLKTIS